MKKILLSMLASFSLSGCAQVLVCDSCQNLTLQSAAQSLSCFDVRSQALDDWAWNYRVTGCNQTAYYACERAGVAACCRRVTEPVARRGWHPTIRHPGGPFPETLACNGRSHS